MITAREFRDKLRGPLNEQCESLRKRIDACISNALLHGESKFTMSVGSVSYEALDLVLGEYRAGGWSIDRVSDSRDGDYLEFMS